jgi:H+/Cl- antiporter ClcA
MAVVTDAGFKGDEIVPTFFIGATFGAVVGPLLCIPSGFAAAIGLVAMFAGVTNTVIASVFLEIEVFGGTGILYFAMACIVSYACSGYNGLYSSQRILYSKVRPEYINLRTNHNHLIKSSRFARMMHGEKPAKHNDNEAGGS